MVILVDLVFFGTKTQSVLIYFPSGIVTGPMTFTLIFLGLLIVILAGSVYCCHHCCYHFEGYLLRIIQVPRGGHRGCRDSFPKDTEEIVLRVTTRGALCWPLSFRQRLHCQYYPRDTNVLVVYFHGSGTDLRTEMGYLQTLRKKGDCGVFGVEYPGFGKNGGIASEWTIIEEAYAVLEYIAGEKRFANKHVYLLGNSLGGAVAIQLTEYLPKFPFIEGIILENTYTSMPDLIRNHNRLGFLYAPFVQQRWDNLHVLQRISKGSLSVRWLFLSSRMDRVVPPEMMDLLKEKVAGLYSQRNGSHITWHPFETQGHKTLADEDLYFDIVYQFIREPEKNIV